MANTYPPQGNINLPPLNLGLILPAVLLLVALSAVGSVFYQVDQDEEGVVQRFGQYVRTTPPGLHTKLPFGIETNKNIKTTHVFKEEFGFRTLVPGIRSVYESESRGYAAQRRNMGYQAGGDPYLEESLMLTGDLNTAVVQWIVQYRVKDAVQFAFHIRNPGEALRNISEAVMRLVVGDHTINEVLTAGREEIQHESMVKLQSVLDEYKSGIEILNVILQDVNPPDEVKPSFNEVNEARQEKEKLINQAWEEYNRVIPKAKGQAEQQMRAAEGYKLDKINRATGDAERFLLTYEAYKKAPVVTRKRLYLEAFEALMPELESKWVLDENQKSLLPLLNIDSSKKDGVVS